MIKEQKNNNNESNKPELKNLPEQFVLSFEEYKALKEKAGLADQYFDKLLRMQAETENIRKRLVKEKEEFIRLANIGLVSEFISLLDEFELAVDSAEKKHDIKLLLEGVNMITKHLQDVLKNQGLSVIDQTGILFDHDKHEAITTVESNEYEENTVVEILRKGYMLNGRTIRPAMVKVSKTCHSPVNRMPFTAEDPDPERSEGEGDEESQKS